jgi:hypothetical protein
MDMALETPDYPTSVARSALSHPAASNRSPDTIAGHNGKAARFDLFSYALCQARLTQDAGMMP